MERFNGKLPSLGTCPICGREIRGVQYFYTTLPGEDDDVLICKRCYNELCDILEECLKRERFVDNLISTYAVPILITNKAYSVPSEEDIQRKLEEKRAAKRRRKQAEDIEPKETTEEPKEDE